MLSIVCVIPTHNRIEQLKLLLDQLSRQKLLVAIVKIIIVVDGSTDGTIEMIKEKFPEVEIVVGTGHWWITRSLNEGCKYAVRYNPDYILILNDDVQIPNDYCAKLIDSYKIVEKESLVGSISYTLKKPNKLTFSGVSKMKKWNLKYTLYHKPYKITTDKRLCGIHATFVLPTRGMIIPFETAKKLNYFDEAFPQYGSDYDFTLRARKMKIPTYISWDAIIFEDDELTGQGSPKNRISFIKYIKYLFIKNSPNSISKNIRFLWRHGNKLLFVFGFLYQLAGYFTAYFYYRKKWRNTY